MTRIPLTTLQEISMKTSKIFFFTVLLLMAGQLFSQEAAPKRKYINLPRPAGTIPPFSDAVLVGNTLYIAGRIGVDMKTGKAPADTSEEIKLLLDGFQNVLTAANMTMDDLVQVQVYCTDLGLYTTFNNAYRNYFKKDFPARAFIGAGPLLRNGRFEMIGIAVKD